MAPFCDPSSLRTYLTCFNSLCLQWTIPTIGKSVNMHFGNKNGFKHGLCYHPLYKVWISMMDRCYNTKSKDFKRYGQRGITVCKKWHSLNNFIKDMSPRPHGRTLDRIDNHKGYSLSNCRWANPKEQASNRRNNRYVFINGEKLTLSEAARKFGFASRQALRHRLETGLSPSDAISFPKHYKRK